MPKRPRPVDEDVAVPAARTGKGHKKQEKTETKGRTGESSNLSSLSFDALLAAKFSGVVDDAAAAQTKKEARRKEEVVKGQQKSRAADVVRATATKEQAATDGIKKRGQQQRHFELQEEEDEEDVEDEVEEGDTSSDDDSLPDMATFQKQLSQTKSRDPSFFAFLQKNDKVLAAAAAAGAGDGEGEGPDSSEDDDEGRETDDDDEEDEEEDEDELAKAAGFDEQQEDVEEEEVEEGRAKKRAAVARASGDDESEDGDMSSVLGGQGGESSGGPPMLTTAAAKSILASALDDKAFRGLARLLHAYRACCYMGGSAAASPDVLQQLGLGLGVGAAGESGNRGLKKAKGDKKGDRSAKKRTVEEEDDEAAAALGMGAGGGKRRPTLRYRIPSSGVFMAIVTGMLERGHAAFAHHLGVRGGASGAGAGAGAGESKKTSAGSNGSSSSGAAPAAANGGAASGPAARVPLSEYAGWPKIEAMVRSFLTASLELLTQARDPSLRLYLVKALRPFVLYLQPFSALTRKYIKAFLDVFGNSSTATAATTTTTTTATAGGGEGGGGETLEQQQSLVVASFLRLRQMGMALPHPTLDAILKGLYRSLLKSGKFMSEEQAPLVLVASHCVSEAFGIDEVLSYQHAFLYIRQLALQLRQALTTKTKEAVLAVYSWQYINACRLWSSVLSRYGADPSKGPLFQLLFPFVQTLLGVARLVPTPRFFPLRMHVVAMLIELSWSSKVFIPYLPLLTDILSSPAVHAKPSAAAGAGGKAPALSFMVKMGKTTLATRAAMDAVVNRAFDLLLDGTKAYYCSIALPETILPVVHSLRAFAKATRVSAWRGRAKALADAFTSQAAKVAAKRATLGVPPCDRVAIASFMNKEAEDAAAERLKARESQASQALMEANARAQLAIASGAASSSSSSSSSASSARGRVKTGANGDDDSEGEDEDYGDAVSSRRFSSARPDAKRRKLTTDEDEGEEQADSSNENHDDSTEEREKEREDGKGRRVGEAALKPLINNRDQKRNESKGKGQGKRGKGEDIVEDLDPDAL